MHVFKKIVVVLAIMLINSTEAPRSRRSSSSSSRTRRSEDSSLPLSEKYPQLHFSYDTGTGSSTDFSPQSPTRARRRDSFSIGSSHKSAPEDVEVDRVSALFRDAGFMNEEIAPTDLSLFNRHGIDDSEREWQASLREAMNTGRGAKMMKSPSRKKKPSKQNEKHKKIRGMRTEMNKHSGRQVRGDAVVPVEPSPQWRLEDYHDHED